MIVVADPRYEREIYHDHGKPRRGGASCAPAPRLAGTGAVIGSDEVTSIRSPRVKAARQLARRSSRQRTRLFLAEGPQAVREALAWGQAAPQPGEGPRGVSRPAGR